MIGVGAVVMWSGRFAEVVAFYRALGVPLEEERHDDGPAHQACELGAVHFAVFDARAGGDAIARDRAGATMVGLRVASCASAVEAARRLGAAVLIEPEEVPWGRRAVVRDPDGRAVELFEPPPVREPTLEPP